RQECENIDQRPLRSSFGNIQDLRGLGIFSALFAFPFSSMLGYANSHIGHTIDRSHKRNGAISTVNRTLDLNLGKY
ncbi:hypothetical protein TNIN_286421, partial [Trichonephila inaurata madagascariensis]